MIALALLLAQVTASPGDVARGGRVFAQSCAVGYCHGRDGAANRGPRLAGRSFDREYLLRVTRDGIANTGMPGWKGKLSDADISAVVDYVMSLSSGKPASAGPSSAPVPIAASPLAARHPGKDLFFDAARVPRCGTCHELDGWGATIGPDLTKVNIADLAVAVRSTKPAASVSTLTLKNGEVFPAVIAGSSKDGTLHAYDLTGPTPALRHLTPAEIEDTKSPGNWHHETVAAGYTAEELKTIAEYLRRR